jgi:hypothetical protein
MAQSLLRDALGVRGVGLGLHVPDLPGRPRTASAAEYANRARRCGEADPANAFFPLMEALGYAAEERPASVRYALRKAAQCSRFESYHATWLRFVDQRAPLLEDRIVLRWRFEDAVALPMAALTYAGDVAEAHETEGRHADALAIRRDLLLLAAIMARSGATEHEAVYSLRMRGTACGPARVRRTYRALPRATQGPIGVLRAEDRYLPSALRSLAAYAEEHGDRSTGSLARAQAARSVGAFASGPSRATARIATLRYAGLVLLGGAMMLGLAWVLVSVSARRPEATAHVAFAPALVACFIPEVAAAAGLLVSLDRDTVAAYPFGLVFRQFVWQQWFAPGAVAACAACGCAAWMEMRQSGTVTKVMMLVGAALLATSVSAPLAGSQWWLSAVVVAASLAGAGAMLAVARPTSAGEWWQAVGVAAVAGVLFLPCNYLPSYLRPMGVQHRIADMAVGAFYFGFSLAAIVCAVWWACARARRREAPAPVRGLLAVGAGLNIGIFATLLWILGRPVEAQWLAAGLLPGASLVVLLLCGVLAMRSRLAQSAASAAASVRTATLMAAVLSLWLYALVGFGGLSHRATVAASLGRPVAVTSVR